jgi:hypothetical protein
MVGFCKLLVKPFGPVQLYVVAPIGKEVRFSAAPEQMGLLLEAETDPGE